MGFYAPAQIVRDVRNHGVEARPADINASIWDNSLERDDRGRFALRLGFRQIDGFRQDWADTLALEREAHGRFDSVEALARCANLRSEEHTSELQSLMRISYAVFCLKKKNTKQL